MSPNYLLYVSCELYLFVCLFVFCFISQARECEVTSSSSRELRLDDYSLARWRYDSIGTLFPAVHKATLYISDELSVDDLDTLRLPALRELCLKRDPYPDDGCKFTDWASFCEKLCSSFCHIEKMAFIDLPIGNEEAETILSSLRNHQELKEIRYIILKMLPCISENYTI